MTYTQETNKAAGGKSRSTDGTELLPCPFCGSKAGPTIKRWSDANGVDTEEIDHGFVVICDAETFNKRGGCGASSPWGETKSKVANAWNTRSNENTPAFFAT